MEHYIVINKWARSSDCESGVTILGVAHSLDEAKKISNENLYEERKYAFENDFEIYEDSEGCFDAGLDGFYSTDHSKLYIDFFRD